MTETQFAEGDGVRLAYDVTGDGAPLVLLHAGIVDRRMWDDVVPLLAGSHRVVRYDARGFGESSRPPDGVFARWDDLFAVIDAAGVRRAHLVGVSQGAETALDAALIAPERVDHLLLCGAGLRGWPFRERAEGALAGRDRRLGARRSRRLRRGVDADLVRRSASCAGRR